MKTRRLVFDVNHNNEVQYTNEEGLPFLFCLTQGVINCGVPLETLMCEQAEDEFVDTLDKVVHHTATQPVEGARERLLRVADAINVLQQEGLI
jgi:hypothetical protein